MTLRQQVSRKYHKLNGNYFSQENFHAEEFEEAYSSIRSKEHRFYDDEVVRLLPDFSLNPSLKKEWAIRKHSMSRLIKYLRSLEREMKILEVGCGNGWLSHHLAAIPRSEVIGLDINKRELDQASRVFADINNLTFLYADVFSVDLGLSFDAVILASSIQYFADPHLVLTKLASLINHEGEIHICDSPIYTAEEVDAARKRSENYFASQEPGMKPFYFHHSWDLLATFDCTLLYKPTSIMLIANNLGMNNSPFPWIRIKK